MVVIGNAGAGYGKFETDYVTGFGLARNEEFYN